MLLLSLHDQFGVVGTHACPAARTPAFDQAGATLDHAMVCTALSGERKVRHHMLAKAWRHVCSQAGVATSQETRLDRLDHTLRHLGQRGILLLAQMAGPQVADVSVTHPAACTCVTLLAHDMQNLTHDADADLAIQRLDVGKPLLFLHTIPCCVCYTKDRRAHKRNSARQKHVRARTTGATEPGHEGSQPEQQSKP
jgi:hypothetical protein